MYIDYFGFTQAPFSITPDPGFLFLSHDHREAFAHLLYGVGDTGGFVQLTGEVGTGKTTLCRYLLENTPEEVDVALILNPRQSALELVASICDELGVGYPRENDSIKTLIDRLNAHLLERHSQGKRTVLVIDEAQNLSAEVLEQIRLLTNLETTRHKLLQILLIGQPELQAIMDRPELRQLDQRITARYHLTSLSATETETYIAHRLAVAGCRKKLFTPKALRQIYKGSQGVPRLINIICDRALLGAYARQADLITPALVRQAEQEIKGRAPARPRRLGLVWGIPALLLLGFIGGWAYTQWPIASEPSLAAKTETAEPLAEKPPSQAIAAAKPAPAGETAAQMPSPAGSPAAQADPPQDTNDPAAEALRQERKLAATENPRPEALALIDGSEPAPPAPASVTAAVPENPEKTMPPKTDLLALAVPREDRPAALPGDLTALLGSGRLKTDAETAYRTLFQYWQLNFDALAGHTACVRALGAGLRCLSRTGRLEHLAAYNRPAVLTLFDERGQVHYVTVGAMTNQQVTLNIGGRERTFDAPAVRAAWNGQFVLLWRPPLLENLMLQKGSRGIDVLWLRDRLARIEGREPSSGNDRQEGYFDEALQQAVMRFQERSHVPVDGVVGEKTLIRLNAAVHDAHTPLLTPMGPGNRH